MQISHCWTSRLTVLITAWTAGASAAAWARPALAAAARRDTSSTLRPMARMAARSGRTSATRAPAGNWTITSRLPSLSLNQAAVLLAKSRNPVPPRPSPYTIRDW